MWHFTESGKVAICEKGVIAETKDCPCGVFLAYESFGTVLKSTSGTSWNEVYHSTFAEIWDIATNGEYWLVSGNNQANTGVYFAKSNNTTTWNENFVDVEARGAHIAWNGNYWIAFAYGDFVEPTYTRVLKSSDGENWSITNLALYKNTFNPVWGESYWLASAIGFDNTNYILKSTNGTTWQEYDSPSLNDTLRYKTYNGTLWVASSITDGIYTSTDGISWINRTSEFYSYIAWNGEYFFAFNISSRIVKSYDGITWEDTDKTFSGLAHYLIWNGSFWIAVGDSFFPFTSTQASKSYDGDTWNDFNIPQRDIQKIASIPTPNIYPPVLKP